MKINHALRIIAKVIKSLLNYRQLPKHLVRVLCQVSQLHVRGGNQTTFSFWAPQPRQLQCTNKYVPHQVELSGLEHLLPFDGALLDVDRHGEDRVRSGGRGVEQCGGRLPSLPAPLQYRKDLVLVVHHHLLQSVNHHRALQEHVQVHVSIRYN